MAKKLKYKLLGLNPTYQENDYQCNLCKEKFGEGLQDDHARKHKRNSYMIEIDIKEEKTDGTNLFRSI